MPGIATLAAEVTHISKHGFWVLLGDEELLLPFEHFPWFKAATVEQISNVERPSPNHLYWPSLDVDLAVESIRHPEAFPLISQS
jgi:Protein of unknown function (DUF2442)